VRIAQVVESAGGGTGRHVLDLTEGLAERGHEVTLIYSLERIEAKFKTRAEALSGVERVTLPFRRQIGLHDISHVLALASVLRRRGPFDVVHGHSSKAGAIVRLLPRSVPGARVYSPHAIRTMDPTLSTARHLFYSGVERLLSYRRGHFVAGSRHEVAELARIGAYPDRITLLDFGIDNRIPLDRRVVRTAYGLDGDGPLLGFVGRLDWQKAPERAVRALARLDDRRVRLALVGEGDLEAELRQVAHREGIEDRVLFLGFQDGQRIMPAFDLLVMPSRYESSPYVLLEAIMANVPVLATSVGMAEQLIGDGRAGKLVPNTDNPAPWADAIALQLQSEQRRIAKTAMHELQASRSLETMIRQIEVVYDHAMLLRP
jgi:glycosyltransferase involved in cell wall biosynthesis